MSISLLYCSTYGIFLTTLLTLTRTISFTVAETVLFGRRIRVHKPTDSKNHNINTYSNDGNDKNWAYNHHADIQKGDQDPSTTCYACSCTLDTIHGPWMMTGPAVMGCVVTYLAADIWIARHKYGKIYPESELHDSAMKAVTTGFEISLAVDVLIICACVLPRTFRKIDHKLLKLVGGGREEGAETEGPVREK
ncbi:unnamed protein product [Cercospora beticola]|nr:unnamed protein product [Cercospora beticola]